MLTAPEITAGAGLLRTTAHAEPVRIASYLARMSIPESPAVGLGTAKGSIVRRSSLTPLLSQQRKRRLAVTAPLPLPAFAPPGLPWRSSARRCRGHPTRRAHPHDHEVNDGGLSRGSGEFVRYLAAQGFWPQMRKSLEARRARLRSRRGSDRASSDLSILDTGRAERIPTTPRLWVVECYSFITNPVAIENISNVPKPRAKGTHLNVNCRKIESATRRIPAIQGKDHSESSLADVVIQRRQ